jgi:hypothetical protein
MANNPEQCNEQRNERKKTLLKFIFGSAEEQPILFRKIINYELIKYKEFMDKMPDDQDLKDKTAQINEMIYISKLKEINSQTEVLKKQMLAQTNGTKHPSLLSIIERKLYIVELQLDIGIYNLVHNKKVKFYFST